MTAIEYVLTIYNFDMKRMLLSAAVLCAAFTAQAVTPLWLRDVQISPDGSQIAFCYMGDIYAVPSVGGEAVRLTTLSSYECNPVWSPDGKQVAFASDRYGNFDVFVMPSEGGNATRLTFNSASETPTTFTPDGANVLFNATIQDPASSVGFPTSSLPELYSVPVAGGKSVQVLGTPAEAVCYSPKGDFFLYQDKKGVEDEWRKHHISSITRDIWRYDVKSGKHTNLTARAGEDRNPVLSADGKTVFLLSEPPATTDGHPVPEGWQTSINVYSFALKDPKTLTPVTSFTTHPVRFLSRGGDKLCFTWNGEIYTQPVAGGEPSKVAISLIRDDENRPDRVVASSGAGSPCVSPDGKQVAFIVRGDVFVTSVEYNTTKQITATPAAERGVTFGHDNRSIVYASERDGVSQLYMAKITRDDDPNFPNATLITEEPLIPDLSVDRGYPTFSPDGKELAFIEDRSRLMVMNMESKEIRQITDGSCWFSRSGGFEYDWSPDGKWFTFDYTPNGHDPYYSIGVISSDGKGEAIDLTGSGYMCSSPRFVLDGNAVLFQSDRYGMRSHGSWGSLEDVFICFLNQDSYDRFRLSKEDYELLKEVEKKAKEQAAKKDEKKDDKKDDKADKKSARKDKKNDKKADKATVSDDSSSDSRKDEPKPATIEPEGIQERIVRLTPNSGSLGDAILSKDGETLYYIASYEGSSDLYKMDLRKRETKVISKGAGGGSFQTDGEQKTIFLLGGSLRKLEGDNLKPISFSAEYHIDHAAEREAMYNYVCREEQERFYTEDMHGMDWAALTENYRTFLPHIANNYDFTELLSELLGELNVSHTGGRYRPGLATEGTASLGLLYDLTFKGDGLRVDEVVKNGPFDHAGMKLAKGDVITAIDGQAITPEQDLSLLLMGKVGKKTLVSIKGKDDVVVLPISSGAFSGLLYDRWVKARAADVEKWSKGRLGYVHIESMDDASFRTIYSDVLGKYNKCEGIVIDVRHNGGGRLHEDVEILFSGEKYLTQVVRGHESCDMPSRRSNLPSIMVQCEDDYSNAHGTPWVYSHQKIGKLVGMPVPGTMTSVNWVTMQDPTLVFGIPVIGYRTAEGYYLEDTQLEPDIRVENTPEDVVRGEDAQLKAAVDELLKEIDAK